MISREAILGEPGQVDVSNVWHYDAERPGWRFIDFTGGGVAVEFDENTVVHEVKDTRWIN
jgi:hypothetical protein